LRLIARGTAERSGGEGGEHACFLGQRSAARCWYRPSSPLDSVLALHYHLAVLRSVRVFVIRESTEGGSMSRSEAEERRRILSGTAGRLGRRDLLVPRLSAAPHLDLELGVVQTRGIVARVARGCSETHRPSRLGGRTGRASQKRFPRARQSVTLASMSSPSPLNTSTTVTCSGMAGLGRHGG